MIADTSIWIDFFRGEAGKDIELFKSALNDGRVVMAPVVLAELFSSPHLSEVVENDLIDLPLAEPTADYWKNCGRLRRKAAQVGFSTALADCLIVQTCLEHDLPLLTRDQTIKKFGPKVGLKLLS